MVRVKICGITNLEDAISAVELGVDALGFVFAPSPRQIILDKAKEIIKKLPPWITTVGVFVDEKPEWIMRVVSQCKLDWVQLHGEESPEYCRDLDIKIIKTIKTDIDKIPEYDVSGILLDISRGTGKVYDWDLAIEAKKYGKPIILSGGLTPENVGEAVRKVSPYGVDVSSGVESEHGKKDYKKLKKFVEVILSRCNLDKNNM